MARFSVTEPVGTFSHFNVMLFVPTADTRMTAAFAISQVDSAYAIITLLELVTPLTVAVAVLFDHAEVATDTEVVFIVVPEPPGKLNENCILCLRQRVGDLHRLAARLRDW